jgi:hypothetical protein
MNPLRHFRRKFGIAAPRVAVRTHVPWYWRSLGVLLAAIVLLVGASLIFDVGPDIAGFRRGEADRALSDVNETAKRQRDELAELRARVAQAERQQQIDRATYGDLSRQVKVLSDENATLKEDLVFFQSLMPAGGREGTVSVNRFKLQADALPGEYRYRLLLVQNGQRAKEFRGSVQLVVNVQQQDRSVVLTLPVEPQPGNVPGFQLNFRFFQRVEGTFRIAPGGTVKGLQVRVFENGTNAPKLTQTVSVS